MSEVREVSMDILPKGMADQFSAFLEDVMKKMTDLVGQADKLARMLDGKDDNKENNEFKNFFNSMAVGANKIVMVVKKAADDAVAKLEDKNRAVGSEYQTKCIDMIREAAGKLSEQEYKESALNGEDPKVFTTVERKELEGLLQETCDLWANYNDDLCEKAEGLSKTGALNELSNVCDLIVDQIAEIYGSLADAAQALGYHMQSVDQQRATNTQSINDAAKADMEQAQQEVKGLFDQIAQKLGV